MVNATHHRSKMAINVGSSSIKTSVFYLDNRVDININFIGLKAQTVKIKYNELLGLKDESYQVTVGDDLAKAATVIIDKTREVLEQIKWPAPTVIGHRVKFAGMGRPVEEFTKKSEEILKFNDYLSSRHNSLCLEVLYKTREVFDGALQLMVRDQAVKNLSLHREENIPFEKSLIRRYGLYSHGYHGLAIKACLRQVAIKYDIENFNGVICQVGSGVSFSTVIDGEVVYNSMQYAACDGPVMHNRAGTQPAGLILRFLKYGLDPSAISNVYNRQSGIYGMAGLPANSTITVEDILSQDEFGRAKDAYLKANGIELFRATLETSESQFIFSGGLATKHRWLGPELLYRARAITSDTRDALVHQLGDGSIFSACENGVTVYLVDIDEQQCILNECKSFTKNSSDLGNLNGVCEVPGTSVGVVYEGKKGWGQGKICLCLDNSEFLFEIDQLPEAFIFYGSNQDDFFLRAVFARNFNIPAIFIKQDSIDLSMLIEKEIYIDTPTVTVIPL
jgi:acetate kinase